ncbi:MAG: penicillin-binding protein activator [Pseudomonadota bacterium]
MQKIHRLNFVFVVFSLFLLSACVSSGTSPWNAQPTSASTTPEALDTKVSETTLPAPTETAEETQISFTGLPPVKVGILLPLTGPQAPMGQSMLQAAQLALFDMGYENFELMPRDTQGTPQGALQATSSAINDGAQLLLGPLLADNVRAAKGVASRRNINLIAFSTDWSLAGNNTYVMGFLPFAQVQRVTRYAAANGIRRMGVIAPADKYGDTVTKAFQQNAQANAIAIVKDQRFNPSERNLAPQLAEFAQSAPVNAAPNAPQPVPFEGVFLPIGGSQAQLVASALSYYGLTPDKVRRLGTGLMDNEALARETNLNGAWFAAPSPRQRRGFEKRYEDTFGAKPLRLASLAYDATALAAVLAASGYQTTGRPAFDRRSLTNPNGFAGIDGIFRFGRNGLVERGLAILEIRNGRIVEADPAPTTFQTLGY